MMTMVSNDLSDVFMLPLATYLSGEIWSILEATKLFLVPFIILMIAAIGQARKQGVDEGSSAIQAYKHIEVGIITMFVVMLFACKPLSSNGSVSPASISVKNYSCLVGGGSISSSGGADSNRNGLGIFNGVDKSAFLNNPFIRVIPASSPTLATGLMNQLSIGLTNASVAALPCVSHTSMRYAFSKIETYEPDNPKLQNLVKDFNKQCYSQALDRKSRDQNLRSASIKGQDYAFDSKDITDMYNGKVDGVEGDRNTMLMKIRKNHWTGSTGSIQFNDADISTSEDYGVGVVTCAEVANEIKNKLRSDVRNGDAKDEFKAISVGDTTNSEEQNTRLLFSNIVNNKGSVLNVASQTMSDWQNAANDGVDYAKMAWSLTKGAFDDLDSAGHVLNGGVASISSMFKSQKVHGYQLVAPLVISVIKGVLIISIPLILFFTGFSPKTLLTVLVAYFAIDFSRFFLELGNLIDEVILSFRHTAVMSNSAIEQSDSLNVLAAMTIIGQYATYTLVGVWYMFVGWLGVKMIAPMQMAESTSEDTSKGSQAALNTAAGAATGGVTGAASSAIKSGMSKGDK